MPNTNFVEGINPTSWGRCPPQQRAACLLYTDRNELVASLNRTATHYDDEGKHWKIACKLVSVPADDDSSVYSLESVRRAREAPADPPGVSEGNLRKAAEHYLSTVYRGCLYGRSWSIPGSMDNALDDVVETVQGVLKAAQDLEQEQE